MSDRSMPDYANEPNEWESSRPVELPRHIAVQIKMFKERMMRSHTLDALAHVRHDIERGIVANNMVAKDMLKKSANDRAREIGFKEGRWWN